MLLKSNGGGDGHLPRVPGGRLTGGFSVLPRGWPGCCFKRLGDVVSIGCYRLLPCLVSIFPMNGKSYRSSFPGRSRGTPAARSFKHGTPLDPIASGALLDILSRAKISPICPPALQSPLATSHATGDADECRRTIRGTGVLPPGDAVTCLEVAGVGVSCLGA